MRAGCARLLWLLQGFNGKIISNLEERWHGLCWGWLPGLTPDISSAGGVSRANPANLAQAGRA